MKLKFYLFLTYFIAVILIIGDTKLEFNRSIGFDVEMAHPFRALLALVIISVGVYLELMPKKEKTKDKFPKRVLNEGPTKSNTKNISEGPKVTPSPTKAPTPPKK